MSTKLKHQQGQAEGGVLPLSRCCSDGCNKKTELMTFCQEHYSWFKFGLLTKEGHRPVDFDKKYQAYMKHHKAA